MDISVIFISLLYPYRRYQERYSPLELYEVDINIKWKGILAGGVIYPEKSILEDVVLCCEDTEAQYFDISNFKWLDFKECNCKARFLPCTPIVEIKRDDKMKIQYKGSCIGIATII